MNRSRAFSLFLWVVAVVLPGASSIESLAVEPGRSRGPNSSCTQDGTTLCLGPGGRFKVQADYRDYSGNVGRGGAAKLTNLSGYFYFFDPANVELVVKFVNFCNINPASWSIYASGLTDVEVTFKVTDMETGLYKEYPNALGNRFRTIADNPFLCQPNNEVTVTLPGGVPLVLLRIPAGTFWMGSPETEKGHQTNETRHQVTLTQDYYIGKYEVTQKQWQAVMGTPMPTSCGNYGIGDDYPVYCVSWNDVAGPGGFIEKLNQQQGSTKFRLPTEAEWERAARVETQTRFSFGDALCGDDECAGNADAEPYVWWCKNAAARSHPVGTKLPNDYGLYDMHGNIWEWVQDRFSYFGTSPETDPTGPSSGSDRVDRGGGWGNQLFGCRSAIRYGVPQTLRNFIIGFRLARSQ